MKIGLIVTVVNSDHVTGVERYALEFLRRTPQELRGSVVVLAHPGGRTVVEEVTEGMDVRFSPYDDRIVTDQLWVPYVVRKLHLQGVYNLSLSHPWLGFGRTPFGLIVHDATPWRFPDTLSRGMRLYYRPQLNRALKSRRLKFVMTVSNSSKEDIQRYCGVLPSMIFPVPLAVDTMTFHRRSSTSIKQDGMGGKYILTVGTLEPRKNLQMLIEAFSSIARDIPGHNLVIVGRRGWLKQLNLPASMRERIVFTGFVEKDELIRLYAGAELFVFPSLYEGFGMPLLEAMSCGAPVLAADTSSLPEVGGEACEYADPNSPEDFARQIVHILGDEELRNQLSSKGQERVRLFNWDRTVLDSWTIIEKNLELQSNESTDRQGLI